MLHTKFRGNRSTDSGKYFERFYHIHGHGSHLGHVTSIMIMHFHFLLPESKHTKCGYNWPSGF